jgi:hypothetical protein
MGKAHAMPAKMGTMHRAAAHRTWRTGWFWDDGAALVGYLTLRAGLRGVRWRCSGFRARGHTGVAVVDIGINPMFKHTSILRSLSVSFLGLALLTPSFGCADVDGVNPAEVDDSTTASHTLTSTGTMSLDSTATDTSASTSSTTTASNSTADSNSSGESTNTVTDSEETGTEASAACTANGELAADCHESVPAGWVGPFVRLAMEVSGEDVACPAAYPEAAFIAHAGLSAPDPVCNGCTFKPEVEACTVKLAAFADVKCITPDADGVVSIAPDRCYAYADLLPSPETKAFGVEALEFPTPSCAPMEAADPQISEVQWEESVAFCGGAQKLEGECEAGQECWPGTDEDDTGERCIAIEGDLECPGGTYANRFVYYAGIEDTRSCGTCAAEPGEGNVDCGVQLTRYRRGVGTAGEMCDEAFESDVLLSNDGSWADLCIVPDYAHYDAVNLTQVEVPSFDGACETPDWSARGEVRAIKPITVCCDDGF